MVLLDFYLVILSRTYFYTNSFCLIYCVCHLHFSGYGIVSLLSVVFASWWVKFGPRAYAGLLVRGTGPLLLVGRAQSYLFDEQDHVKVHG